ncbi:MAG: hypothetical protein KGJ62_03220 [Armatimonadetes bacterium]|nr:hypothetical protein [Armatimonadota bacterium]MDE2205756.1 hypothetical protein [Armatimonadota bacterium]
MNRDRNAQIRRAFRVRSRAMRLCLGLAASAFAVWGWREYATAELIVAADSGDAGSARRWLAAGANVNGTCFLLDDQTPIEHAAFADHPGVARVLLARGADSTTGLEWARDGSWAVIVAILLHGRRVSVDALNRCMWAAIRAGAGGVVCLAIIDGANVNDVSKDAYDQSDDGFTPLGIAINTGDAGLARFLAQHGATVTPAERAPLEALLKAASNEQAAMVRLLARHGPAK